MPYHNPNHFTLGQLRKGAWPPPVYVATLENGSTKRMAFWSQAGKPWDFERGRKLCQWVGKQAVVPGHVLWDGQVIPDTGEAPQKKRTPSGK
ncbi:MAG: hypothetical protein GY906_24230 [bacterium]|nr:hypothetical protein [bacterium]